MNSSSLPSRVGGIYAIINTVSGHFYIGSTVDFTVRKTNHFGQLRKGKHRSPPLMYAFLKYGEQAFVFRELEVCQPDRLLEREQFYIDSLRPEYNTGTCADNARRGVRSSPEHCARISASNTGRAGPMKGKRFTEDHKRKIGEANKLSSKRTGWHHSPESCAKLSAIRKERRDYAANLHTPEARAKAAASAFLTIRARRPDKTTNCMVCSNVVTYRGKHIPKSCGKTCESELRRRALQSRRSSAKGKSYAFQLCLFD